VRRLRLLVKVLRQQLLQLLLKVLLVLVLRGDGCGRH
jgi:hypothetical protein